MSENEDQSPFGRGFAAACIVVGAVLLCGALLLVTGLTSDPSNAATAPGPAQPANPGEPPATSTTPDPPDTSGAKPAGRSASGGRHGGASTCDLPAGGQAIPVDPPVADGWDVSRRVVVPRSHAHGPATTGADGFRRCFAHSPTGAVFAAYSAVAALADQRLAIPTTQKLMLPGPNTQALLRELSKRDPTTTSTTAQLAGYRVIDANQDRATVMLAIPVETAYMSITLTLVWYAGDWRLQPPPPGEPVGAPFSQHRDLRDFVAWSGV